MMKTKLFGVMVVVLFASCKKENTVWETDWSAPIINDTLSLKNMVNDSTLAESGGFYVLDLKRTLFNFNLAELIEIPDTTIVENFGFSGTLNLSPGFSFVNSIEEHTINADGVQLKQIVLKEGFIDVRVENPLPTKTIFTVQLPGVSLNGVTFNNQYEAPPGTLANPGVATETIDLSGYSLDLTGISGGEYNILRSQINVMTDPSGPSVFITPSDITSVEATFRSVKVSYARGYFGNQVVSDTTDVFVEILDKIQGGSIDLPNTSITFEIENGIKVGAQGTLTTVSNENHFGNVVNLSSAQIGTPFNVDPATGDWNSLVPSYKSLVFNSNNSNIEAYLENLGSTHVLGYGLELNPWGNVSGGWDEVFPNSKLAIRMKANMPLNIGMDGIVLRDTFEVALNQDPEKTRIKSGELILQARNGFPISGTVKLLLLDQNDNVLKVIAGSQELRSSEYGTYDSTQEVNVEVSDVLFLLPEDVVDAANSAKKIVVETSFNTVNTTTGTNEQMHIPVGAFLGVKLKTKFKTENRF